jgi:glycosyltransferase involved in cell wall biosynthesis
MDKKNAGDHPSKKVLFLEPFYGGSHRLFADRVVELSSHRVELLTLPASFWKWRMRGAHLSMAPAVRKGLTGADCLLVSDMLSLAELKGTIPELAGIPCIVYFHENQLSYPVPKGESPDVHFGFTNLSTALAADHLVFNSHFHRDEFLGGIESFLKVMPDHRPRGLRKILEGRSSVIYPGIDCGELDTFRPGPGRGGGPTTILWNHRWEFDKGPRAFFRVLKALAGQGLDFKVNLAGENFQAKPTPFLEAREFLGDRLRIYGYIQSREDYIKALWKSDVVVSTSKQEFFGISILEAAYCGCFPLVPNRLVYPEIYGKESLYENERDLRRRLKEILQRGLPPGEWMEKTRKRIQKHWDVLSSVGLLDDLIGSLTES